MRYFHRKLCQFILFQFSVNSITMYHIYFIFFPKSYKKAYVSSSDSFYLINSYYLSGQGFLKNESQSHSVVSSSLGPHGLYIPWNSPGQNTEVSNLPLLQWIFPTQKSNQGLLYCRRILYQLSIKVF